MLDVQLKPSPPILEKVVQHHLSLYEDTEPEVVNEPGGGGGVMPYMCHTETCRRSGYTFWPSNPRQGVFFRA